MKKRRAKPVKQTQDTYNEWNNSSNTNAMSASPSPPPKTVHIRSFKDIGPSDEDYDSFVLTSDDREILIKCGKVQIGYGMYVCILFIYEIFMSLFLFRSKICATDTVYLINVRLEEQKHSVGWNRNRGGSYIFVHDLKRGSDGTLKKRKVVCETLAWSISKYIEIEQKYLTENKPFMCNDMKSALKGEIALFEEKCVLDNSKIPENPGFYKLFCGCYETSSRKKVVRLIDIAADMDVNMGIAGNDIGDTEDNTEDNIENNTGDNTEDKWKAWGI